MNKPKVNSDSQKELTKLGENLDNFVETQKSFDPFKGLTDTKETDVQTKMSNKEAQSFDAPYIKPNRSLQRSNFKTDKIDSRTYFNEEHRKNHERDWEYIRCIVENNELIGQSVEVWTCKWGCDPAHYWVVPVNKPIMVPRLLAEQLAKCHYHRLKMEDGVSAETNYLNKAGQAGAIVADSIVRRIDARPVGFGF